MFDNKEKATISASILEEQFSNNLLSSPDTTWKVQETKTRLSKTDTFSAVEIQPTAVMQRLRALYPKKAPGMDGIPNRALSLLPEEAVQRLTRVINAILKYAVFPRYGNKPSLLLSPKAKKTPPGLKIVDQ